MTTFNSVLTVAICSNRIENIIKYTLPSLTCLNGEYPIKIVLDGSVKDRVNTLYDYIEDIKSIDVIECKANYGHANLRNEALKRCNTNYLLFFDDDISFSLRTIKGIVKKLKKEYDIVGMRLHASSEVDLNRWFICCNQYHYLAIHAHHMKSDIWGACMAFNMDAITKHAIQFDNKLGRQNDRFLSGEDTSLISCLMNLGCKSILILSDFVTHNVHPSRLRFLSLCRRVFWQGVTETVRLNLLKGIKKELRRNFAVITFRGSLLGLMWMIVFFVGLCYGVVYRRNS